MNKFLVLSENSPPAHKTELLSFELTFLYGDLGQRVQECKRAFAQGEPWQDCRGEAAKQTLVCTPEQQKNLTALRPMGRSKCAITYETL